MCALLLWMMGASAQLTVTVSPVKVAGQRAVVLLAMTNNLGESIESARAVCFLLDGQGEMIGQSAQWVIGENHTLLNPKNATAFNFVITSPQPFTTTNLMAKISFSRVVLNGGRLANIARDVQIEPSTGEKAVSTK